MHLYNRLPASGISQHGSTVYFITPIPPCNPSLDTTPTGREFIEECLRESIPVLHYVYVKTLLEQDRPTLEHCESLIVDIDDLLAESVNSLFDSYLQDREDFPQPSTYSDRCLTFFQFDMNLMYSAMQELTHAIHRVSYFPYLQLLQQFSQAGVMLEFCEVYQTRNRVLSIGLVAQEPEHVLADYFLDDSDIVRVDKLLNLTPTPLSCIGSVHQQYVHKTIRPYRTN